MSDTSEHTAAFKVFHYYYKCYVPQSQLYSRDYIEQFGLPTTGNKAIDREMANSKVLAQVTIAEMAEHFYNGAVMSLQDPAQSVEIYKTLREHLVTCQRAAQNPVGGSTPPLEDLRKLDALAGEIYKIARGYMKQAPEDSTLFSKLENIGSRRAMSRKTELPPERQVAAEHQPITDAIAKANFERTKQWR